MERLAASPEGPAPAEGGRPSATGNLYRAGDLCGPYRIDRFLDAGGFSEVYAATHRHTGREAALKVLLTHRGKLKEVAERFQREVELLAALTHVNVVALHDAGTDGDRLWAAMELLEGRSLRLYLHDRGPLDLEEGLRLLFEIGCGVAAAQELGVVHRDLKPENVFRTAGGVAKVLDFGIARFEGWGFQSTGRGRRSLLGTPSYMSPEQVNGETPTFASDVFQMGMIGYEMFAGKHPWAYAEGDFPTAEQLCLLQAHKAPRALTDFGVRDEVGRLIEKAIAKRPDERFPTAEAFAAETWRLLTAIRKERAERGRPQHQQNPAGPDGQPLGPLARRAYAPVQTPPSDESPPSGPRNKVELRVIPGGEPTRPRDHAAPNRAREQAAKTALLSDVVAAKPGPVVLKTLPLDEGASPSDASAQQWVESAARATAPAPPPSAPGKDRSPVWLAAPGVVPVEAGVRKAPESGPGGARVALPRPVIVERVPRWMPVLVVACAVGMAVSMGLVGYLLGQRGGSGPAPAVSATAGGPHGRQ